MRHPSIGPRANCIAAMLARSVNWGNGGAMHAREAARRHLQRACHRVGFVGNQLCRSPMLGVRRENQHGSCESTP